ncbi:hypothetical protein MMC19_005627 [Ptychographa xylographoides]|nr:hypothetical protein [Ptychographa xylographoides]
MASDAVVLTNDNDERSVGISGARSRSLSASSAILLNRQAGYEDRRSVGLESVSMTGGGHSHTGSAGGPQTPTTTGGVSTFSYVPSQGNGQVGISRGGIVNLKAATGTVDPYYRPPRQRRATLDMSSPGSRSRGSWASGGWSKRFSATSPDGASSPDINEGPSISGRETPLPAYLGTTRDPAEADNNDDPRRSQTDYAIREVDYYYGVRGPALSHMPTRRLKTGPADPTGPVSSATGWFKNLFGGKTKEKGKGFEVVRSSRIPPVKTALGEIALTDQSPYRDEPDTPIDAERVVPTRGFELEDEADAVGAGTRHLPKEPAGGSSSDEEGDDDYASDGDHRSAMRTSQISRFPPSLPDIEVGSGIGMPSRLHSKASSRASRSSEHQTKIDPAPFLPRKSSRRTSSYGKASDFDTKDKARLSVIPPSPPGTPQQQSKAQWPLKSSGTISQRIPFGGDPSPSHSFTQPSPGETSVLSNQKSSDTIGPLGGHDRHSSSVLGAHGPVIRGDRPSSLGYVQQHRASDNIHIVNPAQQQVSGSAAELVEAPQRRSITPEP